MKREEIRERVNRVLDCTLPEGVTFKDAGYDSLDMVEMLCDLEEEFGMVVEEESVDLSGVKTVDDVIDFIQKIYEKKE